jgi:hypothetical protein
VILLIGYREGIIITGSGKVIENTILVKGQGKYAGSRI